MSCPWRASLDAPATNERDRQLSYGGTAKQQKRPPARLEAGRVRRRCPRVDIRGVQILSRRAPPSRGSARAGNTEADQCRAVLQVARGGRPRGVRRRPRDSYAIVAYVAVTITWRHRRGRPLTRNHVMPVHSRLCTAAARSLDANAHSRRRISRGRRTRENQSCYSRRTAAVPRTHAPQVRRLRAGPARCNLASVMAGRRRGARAAARPRGR